MSEAKEYSIVGQVTIGTDEYRELIEKKITTEKDYDEMRSKYWSLESDNRKLTDEIKNLKSQLDTYKRYIKESNEQDKMELWIMKLQREE